ncbi:MAG: hypothetical protein LIP23_07150 [Planctomycetes bacterium]|nr:hypothetical protein [Planctomycetota bacterium]
MSVNAINPLLFTHSERIRSGSNDFSVPKSAIRSEGTRSNGRSVGQGTLASDSVEFNTIDPSLYNYVYSPMPGAQTSQADFSIGIGRGNGNDTVDPDNRENSGDGGEIDLYAEAADSEQEAESAEEAEDAEESGEAERGSARDLDDAEQRQVQELKQRDQEVRTHEQAHKAVGGQYAGSISYDYQQGPDGQRYAVGGEVSIDVSKEKDPESTIRKMQQVRAAALAPAQPSSQDQSVAAQAVQTEAEARQELAQQNMEEARPSEDEADGGGEESGEAGDGETSPMAQAAAGNEAQQGAAAQNASSAADPASAAGPADSDASVLDEIAESAADAANSSTPAGGMARLTTPAANPGFADTLNFGSANPYESASAVNRAASRFGSSPVSGAARQLVDVYA